jgi:hypothetical protein
LRTVPWRNQRDRGKLKPGHDPDARIIYSVMNGCKIQLICYGVHKLRLSGSAPDASQWITWDDKPINEQTLTLLLRFDIHPDSLRPMEHRRHKRADHTPTLFEDD